MDEAFRACGLNWQDHVNFTDQSHRPTDIKIGAANPLHAKNELGWIAKSDMKDVFCMIAQASGAKLENRK